MFIKVLQDTLIGGHWTGVGVGNFQPDIAQHLIQIGVAESYEVKVVAPEVFKATFEKKTHSSVSHQAQVLPQPTAKKRRGRKPQSSQ